MTLFVRLASTFFGVGYIPFVPATWASLIGAALAWYFPEAALAMAVFFSVLGIAICAAAQKVLQHKDPPPFVLDEVAGMLLSVLWVPHDMVWYAAGFLLFRFFDSVKPGPIGLLQRHAHPSSIMTDDLLAGVFTNITLQVFCRLIVL